MLLLIYEDIITGDAGLPEETIVALGASGVLAFLLLRKIRSRTLKFLLGAALLGACFTTAMPEVLGFDRGEFLLPDALSHAGILAGVMLTLGAFAPPAPKPEEA